MKPGAAVALAAAVIAAVPAAPSSARADGERPGWEYLYDGGALPFFWGALGARLAIDTWLRPPPQPRFLFLEDIVGLPEAQWENPGWTVTAAGAGVIGLIALGDDEARWVHAKGLAETLATGAALTAAIKVTFGRRRPDYMGPGKGRFGGESRSFLSGHSTQAFEIATYSSLYLYQHGFGDGSPWLHGLAYAGIYAGATLVAAERVYHHRHHLSDVMAGATFGTALAVAFFFYQDGRVPKETDILVPPPDPQTGLSPARKRGGGFPVGASWAWVF